MCDGPVKRSGYAKFPVTLQTMEQAVVREPGGGGGASVAAGCARRCFAITTRQPVLFLPFASVVTTPQL